MSTVSWLTKLRNADLHRLAVLLGTPCSGTKSARIQGIKDALPVRVARAGVGGDSNDREIRLISVDMGIRNLAYAFLSVKTQYSEGHGQRMRPSITRSLRNIKLEAWRKIDISSSAPNAFEGMDGTNKDVSVESISTKQSQQQILTTDLDPAEDTHKRSKPEAAQIAKTGDAYHPSMYANYAYSFISSILEHNPTHIIIERQRFRSGGGANVQEWSLRVGMFEGMLWAVLKTLVEQSKKINKINKINNIGLDIEVQSMLPTRVNRYWLEGPTLAATIGDSRDDKVAESVDEKKTMAKKSGREVKKAKIMIASSIFSKLDTEDVKTEAGTEPGMSETDILAMSFRLTASEQARGLIKQFQQEVTKPSGQRTRKTSKVEPKTRRDSQQADSDSSNNLSDTKINKLDDLADCFLQGLAWIQWRRNRIRLIEEGEGICDTL